MQIAKHFFYKKNLHIWEKSSTFARVFAKKAVLAVFAGRFITTIKVYYKVK